MRNHFSQLRIPVPSRRLAGRNCFAIILVLIFVMLAAAPRGLLAAGIVTFEAESGALGSNWAVSNSTSPVYITILTDGAGNNPSNADARGELYGHVSFR